MRKGMSHNLKGQRLTVILLALARTLSYATSLPTNSILTSSEPAPRFAAVYAVKENAGKSNYMPISEDCQDLVFQPKGASQGFCSMPGDYVWQCKNKSLVLFKCVLFANKPGKRPTHTILSVTDGTSGLHSDTRYKFWAPSGKLNDKVYDDMLTSVPSDRPGAVRARTSFFNEPLLFEFFNLKVNHPSPPFSFAVKGILSGALSLVLNNGTLTLDRIDLVDGNRSTHTRLFSYHKCANISASQALKLRLNPRNFSLSWGDAKMTSAPLPHGVDFRAWGGRTRLSITRTTTVSFRVISELQPSLDPLRPNITDQSYPHYDPLPAVIDGGVPDEVAGFPSTSYPMGEAQPKAKYGVLDLMRPPFFGDPTGARDSTTALERAIEFTRWHYYTLYIPEGNYTITRPVIGIQTHRMLSTGHLPGPLKHGYSGEFLLDGVSSRYTPHYLVANEGATLVVPPSTPSFLDPLKPAAVLSLRMVNAIGKYEPNAQYGSVVIGLTIRIGPHNAGAIGFRLRGAQGSGLEDVAVIFEGGSAPDAGISGVVGACGSGGAHHGIRVLGGRYGLDFRTSQPASTLSYATLVGQSCGAVVYSGFETLTAVGVSVQDFHGDVAILAGFLPGSLRNNKYPNDDCFLPSMGADDQKTSSLIAGMMSWADSSISFAGKELNSAVPSRVAFSTSRSLFLQNVFVFGAKLAEFKKIMPNTPSHTKKIEETFHASAYRENMWTKVNVFAHGQDPPPYAGHPDWQLRAPTFINGVRYPSGEDVLKNIDFSSRKPPKQLCSKHHWGMAIRFPTFMSNHTLNVRDIGAMGDGIHDDGPIIQHALDSVGNGGIVLIPRGVYAISKTLRIGHGVSLIGVGKHVCTLTPSKSFQLAEYINSVTPMVKIDGDNVTLAFLTITVWNTLDSVSAIHWIGGGGVFRQLWFHRASPCGATPTASCHQLPVKINHPIMLVSGEKASLDIYTFFLEDCCHDGKFPWLPNAFWDGFLAGPQGSGYRHLKIEKGAGPVNILHLNCEHGTGDVICEINNAHDVAIYGFKTEGNKRSLDIINSKNVELFGTGGCGCVPNGTEGLYRVLNSTGILLANVMGQGERPSPQENNEFGEAGCDPSVSFRVEWGTGPKPLNRTRPFDRPVAFVLSKGQ